MINLYIANLGKYNEGYLVGEWISLPVEEDDLQETFDRILEGGYEEVAIHDFETDINGLDIGEYSDIRELNEIAEELDRFDKDEIQLMNDYIDVTGEFLKVAMELLDKGEIYYIGVDNVTALGEYVAEEIGDIQAVPTYLQQYFDYKAYGEAWMEDQTGGFVNDRFVYSFNY